MAMNRIQYLDVSYKTARLMKLKPLQVMIERESSRVLEGRSDYHPMPSNQYSGG
ncbi:MAG: hypothetical protein DID91_2727703827 [Candidatus Nitrotoga sp. MKT]|nr:MAG: hypothetical protein DID91_2727703827 [Candidatus Nitrotoga sp. MKT]